jgi:hypothetical protein
MPEFAMTHPVLKYALCAAVALTFIACGGPVEDPVSVPVSRSDAATVAPAAAPALAHGEVASAALAAAPTTESRADAPSLQAQVVALRREVQELRQQVARWPGAAAVAQDTRSLRSDPQARAEMERAEQNRVATSEAAFQNEVRQPQWSQRTAQDVRATLAEADPALRHLVRSVDCRSQSCRVEISPGASEEAQQNLPITLARLAGSLPNVSAGQIDQGDGRMATVLYLSR